MVEGGIIKSFFTWAFKRLALIEDENKVVREVIFNLLDVRHYLSVYLNIHEELPKNIDMALKLFISKMPPEVFEGIPEDEVFKYIKNASEQQLLPTILPKIIEKAVHPISKLEERYSTAINKLAAIHPAKAYYLENQVNLLPLLEEIINITRTAGQESDLTLDQEQNKYYVLGVNSFSNPLKLKLLNEKLTDLEDYIKELAALDSNKQSREDVLSLLSRKQNNNDNEFQEFIQPVIDEAMKSIQGHLNTTSPQVEIPPQ